MIIKIVLSQVVIRVSVEELMTFIAPQIVPVDYSKTESKCKLIIYRRSENNLHEDFSLRGCDWKPQRTSRVLGRMVKQAPEMLKSSPSACPFLPSLKNQHSTKHILLKTKKEFLSDFQKRFFQTNFSHSIKRLFIFSETAFLSKYASL